MGEGANGQMGTEFVIEEVTDLDSAWPSLSELFLGLHEYHAAWTGRSLRNDWEARWKAYLELGPDRLILLGKLGEETIAYMAGLVRREFGLFVETPGIIDDAFVKEAQRHLGLGTAMLRRFEEWSRERNATELRLNVNAANRSGIDFWTKSGFSPASHLMTKSLEAAR